MGDWQELGQAIFIGLIFSFLVAKLISTVISFREGHLQVVREEDLISDVKNLGGDSRVSDEGELVGGDARVSNDDDDDDWEGIESTELDEVFSAATAFVAATAADRNSAKVSNDVQLQLYGLYKIATEGPCTKPQPSALKISARAKWNTWQKLGAMPPEEAMEKYIAIVTELYPSWGAGSTSKNKDEGTTDSGKAAKGPMGPVFSSFVYEEESDNDLKLDAIHACAREGETDNLLSHIENGVPVNSRDSEGRTPLHWAVDRGHLNVVEVLLNRNADVNAKTLGPDNNKLDPRAIKCAFLGSDFSSYTLKPEKPILVYIRKRKMADTPAAPDISSIIVTPVPVHHDSLDNEGQTPLHYAALCEREAVAELLVKHNADTDTKDEDGNSPGDLCSSPWAFLASAE